MIAIYQYVTDLIILFYPIFLMLYYLSPFLLTIPDNFRIHQPCKTALLGKKYEKKKYRVFCKLAEITENVFFSKKNFRMCGKN